MKWSTVRWLLRGAAAALVAAAAVPALVAAAPALAIAAAAVGALSVDLPRDAYTPEQREKAKKVKP